MSSVYELRQKDNINLENIKEKYNVSKNILLTNTDFNLSDNQIHNSYSNVNYRIPMPIIQSSDDILDKNIPEPNNITLDDFLEKMEKILKKIESNITDKTLRINNIYKLEMTLLRLPIIYNVNGINKGKKIAVLNTQFYILYSRMLYYFQYYTLNNLINIYKYQYISLYSEQIISKFKNEDVKQSEKQSEKQKITMNNDMKITFLNSVNKILLYNGFLHNDIDTIYNNLDKILLCPYFNNTGHIFTPNDLLNSWAIYCDISSSQLNSNFNNFIVNIKELYSIRNITINTKDAKEAKYKIDENEYELINSFVVPKNINDDKTIVGELNQNYLIVLIQVLYTGLLDTQYFFNKYLYNTPFDKIEIDKENITFSNCNKNFYKKVEESEEPTKSKKNKKVEESKIESKIYTDNDKYIDATYIFNNNKSNDLFVNSTQYIITSFIKFTTTRDELYLNNIIINLYQNYGFKCNMNIDKPDITPIKYKVDTLLNTGDTQTTYLDILLENNINNINKYLEDKENYIHELSKFNINKLIYILSYIYNSYSVNKKYNELITNIYKLVIDIDILNLYSIEDIEKNEDIYYKHMLINVSIFILTLKIKNLNNFDNLENKETKNKFIQKRFDYILYINKELSNKYITNSKFDNNIKVNNAEQSEELKNKIINKSTIGIVFKKIDLIKTKYITDYNDLLLLDSLFTYYITFQKEYEKHEFKVVPKYMYDEFNALKYDGYRVSKINCEEVGQLNKTIKEIYVTEYNNIGYVDSKYIFEYKNKMITDSNITFKILIVPTEIYDTKTNNEVKFIDSIKINDIEYKNTHKFIDDIIGFYDSEYKNITFAIPVFCTNYNIINNYIWKIGNSGKLIRIGEPKQHIKTNRLNYNIEVKIINKQNIQSRISTTSDIVINTFNIYKKWKLDDSDELAEILLSVENIFKYEHIKNIYVDLLKIEQIDNILVWVKKTKDNLFKLSSIDLLGYDVEIKFNDNNKVYINEFEIFNRQDNEDKNIPYWMINRWSSNVPNVYILKDNNNNLFAGIFNLLINPSNKEIINLPSQISKEQQFLRCKINKSIGLIDSNDEKELYYLMKIYYELKEYDNLIELKRNFDNINIDYSQLTHINLKQTDIIEFELINYSHEYKYIKDSNWDKFFEYYYTTKKYRNLRDYFLYSLIDNGIKDVAYSLYTKYEENRKYIYNFIELHFQYINNKMARDIQTDYVDEIIKDLSDEIINNNVTQYGGYFTNITKIGKNILQKHDKQSRIHNLVMGGGKSTVITPLVIIKLVQILSININKHKDNIYLVMPDTLVIQSYNILSCILSLNYPINVQILKEDRYTYKEYTKSLKNNINTHENTYTNVYIMSDTTMKCGFLNDYELIKNNKDKHYYIFDEIDSILNPSKSEVNYSQGQPCRIELFDSLFTSIFNSITKILFYSDKQFEGILKQNLNSWTNIPHFNIISKNKMIEEKIKNIFMNEFKKYKPDNEDNKNNYYYSVNNFIQESSIHIFEMINRKHYGVSSDIEFKTVLDNIFNCLCDILDTNSNIDTLKDNFKKNYISKYNNNISINEINNDKEKNLLNTFIENTLSYIFNEKNTTTKTNIEIFKQYLLQNHGINYIESKNIIVPFIYNEVPDNKSQYTNPLFTIALTIIAYLNNINLDNIEINNNRTHIMIECIKKEKEKYGNIYTKEFKQSILFKEYTKLKLNASLSRFINSDNVDVSDIRRLFKSEYFIKLYLMKICETEITIYKDQYNISGIDLIMNFNINNKSGFTGTPNICKFEDILGKTMEVLKLNQETEEMYNTAIEQSIIKTYNSKKENNINITPLDILDNINNDVKQDYNIRVLIDIGGILIGTTPMDVYNKIIKNNNKIFIYWNSEHIPMSINKNIIGKWDGSNHTNNFFYYYHQHIVGTDAIIQGGSKGICLVGNDTIERDVQQGIFRMRKLAENKEEERHTAIFYINDTLNKLTGTNIKLKEWFKQNEIKMNESSEKLMKLQNLRAISRYLKEYNIHDLFKIANNFRYPTKENISEIYNNIEDINKLIDNIIIGTKKYEDIEMDLLNRVFETKNNLELFNLLKPIGINTITSTTQTQQQILIQQQQQNIGIMQIPVLQKEKRIFLFKSIDEPTKIFNKFSFYYDTTYYININKTNSYSNNPKYSNINTIYFKKHVKYYNHPHAYLFTYINSIYNVFIIPLIEGISLITYLKYNSIYDIDIYIYDSNGIELYKSTSNKLNKYLCCASILLSRLINYNSMITNYEYADILSIVKDDYTTHEKIINLIFDIMRLFEDFKEETEINGLLNIILKNLYNLDNIDICSLEGNIKTIYEIFKRKYESQAGGFNKIINNKHNIYYDKYIKYKLKYLNMKNKIKVS